jgi:DNA-binding MarR family transcriptional regulator
MTQATTLFGQDLGVASRAGQRVLSAVIGRAEISFPQWVVLKSLHEEGGRLERAALVVRLADGLGLPAPAVEAALDGLRARGLVGDGVGLTDDGQDLYGRLAEQVAKAGAELLDGMPADDLDAARRVLAEYTRRAGALVAKGI